MRPGGGRWLRHRVVGAAIVIGVLAACRGRPPGEDRSAARVQHVVDSLVPLVEQAVGLTFKQPPRWAMRSPEQLREYLRLKFHEQLPPETIAGVETAYRLFAMIPDSVEIESVMLRILAQQVQGFYEPDSTTLFLVRDAPLGITLTLAHELVHALQDQYLPLHALMDPGRPNDELMALQAVLEGQAQFASVMMIAGDRAESPSFWDTAAAEAREAAVDQLSGVPLILREALLFPYLDGARFMYWWSHGTLADTVPFGPRMPVSTEQILHPSRYLAGEKPVNVVFTDSSEAVTYQDDLGEFEIGVLHATLFNLVRPLTDRPIGWNGDRYRVYSSAAGPALVWYTAWDDTTAASRFLRGTARRLMEKTAAGYEASAVRSTVDGVPLVRVSIGPTGWSCDSGCVAAVEP